MGEARRSEPEERGTGKPRLRRDASGAARREQSRSARSGGTEPDVAVIIKLIRRSLTAPLLLPPVDAPPRLSRRARRGPAGKGAALINNLQFTPCQDEVQHHALSASPLLEHAPAPAPTWPRAARRRPARNNGHRGRGIATRSVRACGPFHALQVARKGPPPAPAPGRVGRVSQALTCILRTWPNLDLRTQPPRSAGPRQRGQRDRT